MESREKKHKFSPPIFEGYSPYIGSTGSSLKGGCGLYISNDMKYQPRKDLNIKIKEAHCEVETCWIELIIENQPNFLICVVYRHPKKDDTKTTENISATLDKIKKEKKKTLVIGDTNYDLLNHERNNNISTFLRGKSQFEISTLSVNPTLRGWGGSGG